SLEYIAANGGVITDAVSTQQWPGDAQVHVSLVNWIKQPTRAPEEFALDGKPVDGITPELRPPHKYTGKGDRRCLAPSMHLAAQRISLTSLYFIGRTQWKDTVSRDLGKIIEAYVGDQLRSLDTAVVTGERSYKIKKNTLMTADLC